MSGCVILMRSDSTFLIELISSSDGRPVLGNHTSQSAHRLAPRRASAWHGARFLGGELPLPFPSISLAPPIMWWLYIAATAALAIALAWFAPVLLSRKRTREGACCSGEGSARETSRAASTHLSKSGRWDSGDSDDGTRLFPVRCFGLWGRAPGDLNNPRFLLNVEPGVMIADSGNDRLQAFSPEGKHLRTIHGTRPGHPTGLASDGSHLWVADRCPPPTTPTPPTPHTPPHAPLHPATPRYPPLLQAIATEAAQESLARSVGGGAVEASALDTSALDPLSSSPGTVRTVLSNVHIEDDIARGKKAVDLKERRERHGHASSELWGPVAAGGTGGALLALGYMALRHACGQKKGRPALRSVEEALK